jgi:hypothetical protein
VLGVARARPAPGLAGEHPRHLHHPGVTVEQAGRGHGAPGLLALGHRHLGVGEGGHLGQVGHHQDLEVAAQRRQRAAHDQGRLAPDTGVDLVENERGRRSGRRRRSGLVAPVSVGPGRAERQAQGQHGAGELAPRGGPGQWEQWLSGVGSEQEADVVAGVVGAHRHLQSGPGQGQGVQAGFDGPGQEGRRRPASLPHLGGRPCQRHLGLAAGLVQLAGPTVVALQLLQALSPLGLDDQEIGEGSGLVATAQLAQEPAAGLHPVEAGRVLLDRLPPAAQVSGHLAQFGGQGAQPSLQLGEGATTGHRYHRLGQGVPGPAVADQGLASLGRGLAVGRRPGQQLLLRLQGRLLVRVAHGGLVELVELEAHQIELAVPLVGVTPERGQLGVDRGQIAAGGGEHTQVDRSPAVEGRPLGRGVQ